jgi:hypothetical protein
LIETFADNPASRWRFFTDAVMGGVSSGQLNFDRDDHRFWARMTGTVSTANNGGFIQMQTRLQTPFPLGNGGVRLVARGDGQGYFIHLRCTGASTPTAFHRAGFAVTPEWREITLPFNEFTPANRSVPALCEGTGIATVAVVAYGKNFQADVSVSEIGSY